MNIALVCTDGDLWAFGTRLISSVLRQAGHSTRLILLPSEAADYSAQVLDEVGALVRESDLVGISCYSRGSRKARQVAASLRERKKFTVWGGLHASLNPAECAAVADIVCRGEGEHTIVELADALEDGRGWEDIRNLACEKRDGVMLNALRPPIASLDELPLLDFERSNEFHLASGRMVKAPGTAHSSRMQYIGSRGCAFLCTYCCNRKIKEMYRGNGRYLRRMSPAQYVDQLAELHDRYFPNATDAFLLDEDFLLRSVDEIREFARLYRDRVKLPFDCMVSPPRVTDEKMQLLVEAGLWRISLGVESGSERTKTDVFDRSITNEAVMRASQTIVSHPTVAPCYFFIIGNPYEDRQDLLDTLALMARMAYPYYANIYNLVFFPGSALFDRAVRDGIIRGTQDSGFELHFRAGLNYSGHSWKQKNLYLNGLLFMTEGKSTRHRLGLLPRKTIPFLTRPKVIDFMDRQRFLCGLAIPSKILLLRLRSRLGGVVKRWMKNPADAYNVAGYLKRRFAPDSRAGARA